MEVADVEPKVVVDGVSSALFAAEAHPVAHPPRAPGVPPPLPISESPESASSLSDIPVEVEGEDLEGALPEDIFAEADAVADQGELPRFQPFGLAAGAEPPDVRPMPMPPQRRAGNLILLGTLGLVVAAGVAVLVWYLLRSTVTGPAPTGVADAASTVATVVALADAADTGAVGALPDVAQAGAGPGEAADNGAETAATDGGTAADAALEDSAAAPEVLLDAGGEATTVTGDAELPADDEVADGDLAEGDGGSRARERVAKNLVQQGMAALSGRRFAEARDAFTRALLIDPRAHGARLGLGRVAFQQGQFEDAVRYLEPAYRNQGNMELGIAYVRVGRTADAKQQFERVLARDPNNAAAQRALQSLR